MPELRLIYDLWLLGYVDIEGNDIIVRPELEARLHDYARLFFTHLKRKRRLWDFRRHWKRDREEVLERFIATYILALVSEGRMLLGLKDAHSYGLEYVKEVIGLARMLLEASPRLREVVEEVLARYLE